MNLSNVIAVSRVIIRRYSNKIKLKVTANEEVLKNIENEVYKPRNHPGIVKTGTITLPESFVSAIRNVSEDYPVKAILQDSEKMCLHLKGKVPPMESDEVRDLKTHIYERTLNRESQKLKSPEMTDTPEFKQKIKDIVINILKKKIYNWSPMTYDAYNSLVYLYGRGAPEYAVLVKILAEISKRDEKFKPTSLFDFGSGIGTGTWAANVYWRNSIYEYFNVDTSSFMNDLAQLLLQDGRGTKKISVRGVFYRQFLPASNKTYDLVICAYTLLELPSSQSRLETILKLWNKTEKYLIIVEQGTNAGFKVITEARDYILQIKDSCNVGHVFSPCPHDFACPRFIQDNNTPCNFIAAYMTPPSFGKVLHKKELYSYVILKKGKRSEDDDQWPRVVRETLIRSKHTICRICTSSGNLDEVIFTASKNGKQTYHCARSTKWGDRLPITIKHLSEASEKINK